MPGSSGNGPEMKRPYWYGRKAMAAYSLVLLGIGGMTLVFGDGLWHYFARYSAIGSVVEDGNSTVQTLAPEPATGPVVEADTPHRERVFFGLTAAELRSRNNVRSLRYEEQSAEIGRLSGIYGYTLANFFESNMRRLEKDLLHNLTLQSDQDRFGPAVVEIHKTVDGKVRIVGYVDAGTVAKLVDESEPVGSVFLYHKLIREGQVLVAIPASRVVDWDYRAPHEFSEIEIN